MPIAADGVLARSPCLHCHRVPEELFWSTAQSLRLVAYPRNLAVITQEYRTNRARFPQSALVQYQGTWVAFSADGCRIVASGETVEQVEEQLAVAGEHAQRVVLEWVAGPEDDSLLGGGEWM